MFEVTFKIFQTWRGRCCKKGLKAQFDTSIAQSEAQSYKLKANLKRNTKIKMSIKSQREQKIDILTEVNLMPYLMGNEY